MKPKTLIEHMRAVEAHTDAATLKAWAADNADAFNPFEARTDLVTTGLSYREKLAEKIFVITFSDNSNTTFYPIDSFRAADAFIAEIEKQRNRNRSTLGSNVDISA